MAAFTLAYWLNSKSKLKFPGGGLVPLLVGLAGSMLLYASPASQTALAWANGTLISPLCSGWASWTGEALSTATVHGTLTIAGAVVTVADVWKNHKYNAWALAALLVTPIAAHGSAGGWLPEMIDAIHTGGAGVVAGFVGGAVGG